MRDCSDEMSVSHYLGQMANDFGAEEIDYIWSTYDLGRYGILSKDLVFLFIQEVS